MELNVRKDYHLYFLLFEYFQFHNDHYKFTSILGTLCFSCSQGSIKNIISTSLEIQLNIGHLLHEKPPQLHEMIQSVQNSYLLISLQSLSFITSFLFLIFPLHLPFYIIFPFRLSSLTRVKSSEMSSSFINILFPFSL